jgi:hypothetical protein
MTMPKESHGIDQALHLDQIIERRPKVFAFATTYRNTRT